MKTLIKSVLPEKIVAKLASIKSNPSYIGRTLKPDTMFANQFFFYVSKGINYSDYKNRILSLFKDTEYSMENYDSINIDDGYAIRSFKDDDVLERCIEYCTRKFVEEKLQAKETLAQKSFLKKYKFSLQNEADKNLFEFTIDPKIIMPVAKYIGSIPVLGSAEIWYSPNTHFVEKRSQQYHLDGEDLRQIKCFIPLKDIDEDCGPLTIIPAKESLNIYNNLRRKNITKIRNQKLPDEIIYGNSSIKNGIALTGKVGDVIFVDTCRCYHYGSRPNPNGSKPRLVLMLQFYSAFCSELPLWGRKAKTNPFINTLYGTKKRVAELVFRNSHLHYPTVFNAQVS